MKKYDNLEELDSDAVETFLNDLDESDIVSILSMVGNLDRLALDDEKKPVFSGDEIDAIGKVVHFLDDEGNYKSDDEDDVEEDEDEDGDIPGTGEDSDTDEPLHIQGTTETTVH